MVSSGDVTKEGFHLTEYTELRHKTVKARHIKNKVNLIYGIPFKQYNNNLIHDKKNQSILIKEELKILLDKLLFLKNVLKNGIKVCALYFVLCVCVLGGLLFGGFFVGFFICVVFIWVF